MDINMQKRNEVLAQNVIKGLESRNMSGYYAADREAAVKQAGTDPGGQQYCHGWLHKCS